MPSLDICLQKTNDFGCFLTAILASVAWVCSPQGSLAPEPGLCMVQCEAQVRVADGSDWLFNWAVTDGHGPFCSQHVYYEHEAGF